MGKRKRKRKPRKQAIESAAAKPEAQCDGSPTPCTKPPVKKKRVKPPCPDGCSKNPQIIAKQINYTVVLDKAGQLLAGYPILEFEISNGCPNHYIDVQVAKKDPALLAGGPGLANSWDKSKTPKDRITQQAFSSWTNGETSLKLDGAGKATYKMPLDWWRDLARQPRSIFTTMKIHFRVLAFCDPKTPPVNSANSSVDVNNNLVDFKVVDNGYINGGVAKSISMEFTVKELDTTEMYTFVQWMQGYFGRWAIGSNSIIYPEGHRLYDIDHIANFPDFTIDRVSINPRYWNGTYTISNGGKTATATDAPSQGAIGAGFSHYYSHIDFETRVHLNYDVPSTVNIIRKDGSPPMYGVITGNLLPPEPLTLDSNNWNTRVLQVRDPVTGAVTTTHPATFAGP